MSIYNDFANNNEIVLSIETRARPQVQSLVTLKLLRGSVGIGFLSLRGNMAYHWAWDDVLHDYMSCKVSGIGGPRGGSVVITLYHPSSEGFGDVAIGVRPGYYFATESVENFEWHEQ